MLARSLSFCVTVGLAIGLAPAASAGPYDGLYYPEGQAENWDCQRVGADGGAISVQDNSFEGVENRCTLTEPVAVRGMNATLYDAKCNGEGMTYEHRMMLLSSPPGLTIIRDGYASYFERCPEQ
ncbi:MAG: hypothetical protein ACRBB0_18690 [Pelagimonas sp.]|uniref:hypothetical protein n=1 Tax=Pelagimonas sp. TaxID=2073170 RepID=UPI003D6A8067